MASRVAAPLTSGSGPDPFHHAVRWAWREPGRLARLRTAEREAPIVKLSRNARRLRAAVVYSAARGAAYAAGSGLVGLASWWLTHHAHLIRL